MHVYIEERKSMKAGKMLTTPFAEITDTLYLSSYQSITEDKVRDAGITHIINITEERDSVSYPSLPRLTHTRIRIPDSDTADILSHLDTAGDKIQETRRVGGKTLVHCVMGISRSATLCIAYMMKYEGMTLRAAYYHVKKRRSIHPNIGFWAQLVEYEDSLYGKISVEMLPYDVGFLPSVYREEGEVSERWAVKQTNVMSYVQILLALASVDLVSSVFWYLIG